MQQHEKRNLFFESLLKKSNKEIDLFVGTNPHPSKTQHWINQTNPRIIPAVQFSYSINSDMGCVALYLTKRPDLNKQVFNFLKSHRSQIERKLGQRIDWRDRKPSGEDVKNPNLYVWIEGLGGYDTPETWDRLHPEMIRMMKKLYEVLSPYLRVCKDALDL